MCGQLTFKGSRDDFLHFAPLPRPTLSTHTTQTPCSYYVFIAQLDSISAYLLGTCITYFASGVATTVSLCALFQRYVYFTLFKWYTSLFLLLSVL